MISELDTDCLERVELNYVSERTDSFHSAYVSPRTEQTVYDDRQEGFSDFMADLGTKIAEEYGATVEVSAYEGEKHSAIGRATAVFWETSGVSVSVVGNDDAIEAYMEGVAKGGYGLPQDKSFIADWHHPIQSVKGYMTAKDTLKDLEGDFTEVRDVEGNVSHVTYQELDD